MSSFEMYPTPYPREIDSHLSIGEQPLEVSIEVFSQQGKSDKNNEDATFVNVETATAGVCDGASDIVGYKTSAGETGGAIAAKIAAETFQTLPADRPLVEAMIRANDAINDVQVAAGIDTALKSHRFCSTAAVARIRQDQDGRKWLDLLQVADSVAIVVYDDGRVEAPLGIYDLDEETMVLWSQLADEGLKGKAIRQDPRMKSQIESKRNESNDTYGVMNGEDDAARFVQSITISGEGVSKVILLTDGMFTPRQDRSVPDDWTVYARLEAAGGLRAIYDHVHAIEESDPELTKYARFKIHDDASGAVLAVK